jgi:glycolate oxidase iron-sulfur subunit
LSESCARTPPAIGVVGRAAAAAACGTQSESAPPPPPAVCSGGGPPAPRSGTEQARDLAAKARDITEVLAKLDMPTRTMGLTVAYHAACSLQHGQQIKSLPKDLLKHAGFRVVEPADSHLCCGSAGTYNMLQPEISGQLRDRKRATLAATKADVIAAGNIGCMMQIGGDIPIVHMVQLLDWAFGGPKPAALGP